MKFIDVLRILMIGVAAIVMIGTGLCSLVSLPFLFGNLMLLPVNLIGWGVAVGMFYLIRSLRTTGAGLDAPPDADPPPDAGNPK